MKKSSENPKFLEPVMPADKTGLGPTIYGELERREKEESEKEDKRRKEVGPFKDDERAPIYTTTIENEENPEKETTKALEGIQRIFGKDTPNKK
jgi:hypothetical protein